MARLSRIVVPGCPHHIYEKEDLLLVDNHLFKDNYNWVSYLDEEDNKNVVEEIRRHARTGRPLGDERFIEKIERITGRKLKKKKPGPKSITNKNR